MERLEWLPSGSLSLAAARGRVGVRQRWAELSAPVSGLSPTRRVAEVGPSHQPRAYDQTIRTLTRKLSTTSGRPFSLLPRLPRQISRRRTRVNYRDQGASRHRLYREYALVGGDRAARREDDLLRSWKGKLVPISSLLWQIYSRCVLAQICFRQCGHRCGGASTKLAGRPSRHRGAHGIWS
jgi:hypothetical protein